MPATHATALSYHSNLLLSSCHTDQLQEGGALCAWLKLVNDDD